MWRIGLLYMNSNQTAKVEFKKSIYRIDSRMHESRPTTFTLNSNDLTILLEHVVDKIEKNKVNWNSPLQ